MWLEQPTSSSLLELARKPRTDRPIRRASVKIVLTCRATFYGDLILLDRKEAQEGWIWKLHHGFLELQHCHVAVLENLVTSATSCRYPPSGRSYTLVAIRSRQLPPTTTTMEVPPNKEGHRRQQQVLRSHHIPPRQPPHPHPNIPHHT